MSQKLFYVHDTTGEYLPATPTMITTRARDIIAAKLSRSISFGAPKDARRHLPILLGALEHEKFCVAYVDNRHRLIAFEEMFRGTIDGASVHPREVVKQALAHNAAAVIFAHNHPSGVGEPSQADELITRRLKEALALVDIRVLDHFIVAGADVTSFAERGLL